MECHLVQLRVIVFILMACPHQGARKELVDQKHLNGKRAILNKELTGEDELRKVVVQTKGHAKKITNAKDRILAAQSVLSDEVKASKDGILAAQLVLRNEVKAKNFAAEKIISAALEVYLTISSAERFNIVVDEDFSMRGQLQMLIEAVKWLHRQVQAGHELHSADVEVLRSIIPSKLYNMNDTSSQDTQEEMGKKIDEWKAKVLQDAKTQSGAESRIAQSQITPESEVTQSKNTEAEIAQAKIVAKQKTAQEDSAKNKMCIGVMLPISILWLLVQ